MFLKTGIEICSDFNDKYDFIEINNGVEKVDILGDYKVNSYIPNKEWRKLKINEYKQLIKRSNNKITIGDIPHYLKTHLSNWNINKINELNEVPNYIYNDEDFVKKLNVNLNRFLNEKSLNGVYKFHKLTRSKSNLETVTKILLDNGDFSYIGLHLDRSQNFTPHTAYKSGNRISINIGLGTRYLNFVNLSLIQIYNMLLKIGIRKEEINRENITYLFFKNFSNYPIIRIIQKPYQYYIFNTDNFIHDASTVGNKNLDYTLVYTGNFKN